MEIDAYYILQNYKLDVGDVIKKINGAMIIIFIILQLKTFGMDSLLKLVLVDQIFIEEDFQSKFFICCFYEIFIMLSWKRNE